MAASASVQSSLSLPTKRVGHRSIANHLQLSSVRFHVHRSQRVGSLQVRCMSEEKLPPSSSQTPPPPASAPAPQIKKVSTKFTDVLAFGGPAPERINGRLAMVGFVAAIAAELSKGDDVVSQLANGGLPWFLYISVMFTLASLVPMFSGVSVESKSKGLMTSDAEMLNGRAAMLGLVALVFTEFLKGGALV